MSDGFRVAILADPQMEGSERVGREGRYGQLNNVLNDIYFRHIVKNVVHYWDPREILVLGDIFSSQMIHEAEFQERVQRYKRIIEPVRDVFPISCLIPSEGCACGDQRHDACGQSRYWLRQRGRCVFSGAV